MKQARTFLALSLLLSATQARAETYEVGEGKALPALSSVPWQTLGPGDVVRIHYRTQPYREKFVLAVSGTSSSPIRIEGVPGPKGERPVIDGEDATTPMGLSYWGGERSVIKIGGANGENAGSSGEHLILDGLEIRGARSTHNFRSSTGAAGTYADNAAAIFIEHGEHIVVRNCALFDSGNGLFVAEQSRDIRVELSEIEGNGNPGSIYEHNVYSEALGIVFEGNHLGPLCDGCPGNNLKDRSAGTVIRYNWIEGGNRQLDLVDSDNATIQGSATYAETHVYGNVLIEHNDTGNRQIVHWGGDGSNVTVYRKGTLFLYGNTIISERAERTTLLRNSSPTGSALVYGNIIYCSVAGAQLEILSDAQGKATLRNNWLTQGFVPSFAGGGAVDADESNLRGFDPRFMSDADFRLASDSPCLNKAVFPAVEQAHRVIAQAPEPRALELRPQDDMPDIGAIERGKATPLDGSVGNDAGASSDASAPRGGAGIPSLPPYDASIEDDVSGAFAEPAGRDGCSCRVGARTDRQLPVALALLLLSVWLWRIRRSASRR